MARKTYEELNKIKEKFGVDTLWSWSRYNTYRTSKFEYFLKYIIRKKEDRNDSIYTFLGSLSHDILEKFYLKEIEYKEMIDLFTEGWDTFQIAGLKFDRTDNEKNNNISQKYKANMEHFFRNHVPHTQKVDIERFITIKIGEFLFQGYIDLVTVDEDGNYVIQDHKTSSIYQGKKIEKESGQLILYSEGLRQLGIPIEKIKACWNFLKYCTVAITQANGKIKERNVERSKIGDALQTNAKMWLRKLEYSDKDVENYLSLLLQTNSIECLPDDVKEKYKVGDCYVYIDLNEGAINNLKVNVINTLSEIVENTNKYHDTLSDELFWDTFEEIDAESYYYAVLSGYSANSNKAYGAYLDELNKKKDERNSVFGGVGSDADEDDEDDKGIKSSEIPEDDLSWLDLI